MSRFIGRLPVVLLLAALLSLAYAAAVEAGRVPYHDSRAAEEVRYMTYEKFTGSHGARSGILETI